MFFVLSKILSYLIMPVVLIAGFMIASAVVKRSRFKKMFFYVSLSILLFFSNSFICNEVMKLWEIPVTEMKHVKTYQWGIVLSGVTKSESGPRDRIYFTSGADRVTHALQLYKMGRIKKILVSGGSGKIAKAEQMESEDMAQALILMGVPKEDILTEVNSRNTHESAVEVKKILERNFKPTDCLLITSAYHMRRSAACYKKVGWELDCFSVDFLSHRRKFTPDILFIPQEGALHDWQILLKEFVGMITYKLAGYV